MSTTESSAPREQAGRKRDRAAGDGRREATRDTTMQVRAADLEPYVGLRYVTKLFRIIALFLVLLLVAEVAVGLYQQGWDAVVTLLPEATRLLVAAGLLWGVGDMALLMIDIGHDVRATRILIGRQAAHAAQPHQRGEHHRASDAPADEATPADAPREGAMG
jgi:hypothetical protein